MPKRAPLVSGQRFGRLVVIGEGTHRTNRQGDTVYHAQVLCDCGTQKSIAQTSLKMGMTRSCGCLQLEWAKSGVAQRRHGLTGTRTHRIWASMLSRCSNPNQATYARYGARGIRVCKRWQTFDTFLADMGECPSGMSIDRINGKGDYKRSNCRWATPEQQGFNNPQVKRVMLNGERVSFSGAARRLNITPQMLHKIKLRRGLTHQQAVDHYAARQLLAGVKSIHAP